MRALHKVTDIRSEAAWLRDNQVRATYLIGSCAMLLFSFKLGICETLLSACSESLASQKQSLAAGMSAQSDCISYAESCWLLCRQHAQWQVQATCGSSHCRM